MLNFNSDKTANIQVYTCKKKKKESGRVKENKGVEKKQIKSTK